MNLICEARSLISAKRLMKNMAVNIIVVGIDFLSLDEKEIEIFELEKLVLSARKHNKEIAINATKIFHEDDLEYVLMLLKNSIFKHVDYFLYSDMGFYQILVKAGLSDKAIIFSPTYLTNTQDVNVYNKLNAYVVLSNQISKKELIKICENSNKHVIVDGFGMAMCFYSRRMLVSNYLKYKNIKLNKYMRKSFSLVEETRSDPYHLVEDENGVRIYEPKHYFLLEELKVIPNCDFLYLHHTGISIKDYEAVVKIYSLYLSKELNLIDALKALYGLKIPLYKGAYTSETILLKGDEKDE